MSRKRFTLLRTFLHTALHTLLLALAGIILSSTTHTHAEPGGGSIGPDQVLWYFDTGG